MLTPRQNLLETIKGGNPDRFVKQYEFMELVKSIPGFRYPISPGQTVRDPWGITFAWPEGQIGAFPVHDEEHKVIKDITKWKDVVKVPPQEFSEEDWGEAVAFANAVDRNEKFVAPFWAPGVFEMTHHMMGMEQALMALYEEPECMHELIGVFTEYELQRAKSIIDHIKPDALFHHDDWGSNISTFFSPDMFVEFFLESYKRIYKFWKDNGVELVIHHSDSYAATLVPHMIEMGVDIWQGATPTNDLPEMVKKYGGQISFMGGLESGKIDFPEWTPEICAEHVEEFCRSCGKHYFIPCQTQGAPFSSFPGVYEEVNRQIDIMSEKLF